MSASAPRIWATGAATAATCSACSRSTRAARASPSAWTTASSASSSTPTAARASASSAGRSPTPPRSMRSRARLEASGTPVARGSRALADERHVADLIVFNDPAGNRLEIFHGAQTAADPFEPGRNISGFRTGPLGMGHVVIHLETHRRGDDVLSGGAGLPDQRLLASAVPGLLPPRQSAAPFDRVHRERRQHGASHDGRALQLRRRRPGLRSRAHRAGEGRRARSGATRATTSPRSTPGTRPAFWSSTAGARRRSTTPPGQPFERKFGPSFWGHERALDVGGEAGRVAPAVHRGAPTTASAGRCR